MFLTVKEVLAHNVDSTMGLLRKELQIRKGELEEQLFFASLERIFIEERIYKEKRSASIRKDASKRPRTWTRPSASWTRS